MKLSWWKITAIVIACIIALLLLTVIGYVIYVVCDYSRLGDNISVDTVNNQTNLAKVGQEYSIVTYNIGFGAYDKDYDFFMDYGQYQPDFRGGKETTGTHGKATSKQHVIDNTLGCINAVDNNDFDFMLFQEVDTDSTRSYHVNQLVMLAEAFSKDDVKGINKGRASAFAVNYHSPYFLYPFNDPHGKSNAGIATFSKCKIDSNLRREYPISNKFDKFFDLDRCFMITRIPVEGGKILSIINSHMSAYDKGGTIRIQQLELLNSVLKAERDAGNYVIVGGDFNHDITGKEEAKTESLFPTKQVYPGWIFCLTDDDLTDGFSFKSAINCATCRAAEIPYEEGVNFLAVLDGFIVSDNIEVTVVENIDAKFAHSDHNPATMKFILK